MKPPFPVWLTHLIVISLFIAYEVTFILLTGYKGAVTDFIPFYILAIIYFYANAHLVMPLWEKGRRALTFALILFESVSYFFIITFVGRIMARKPLNPFNSISPVDNLILLQDAYRSIYLLGLSISYWLGQKALRQKVLLYEQQLTIAQLELDYLRAQANPHLVFNILNNVMEDISSIRLASAETIAHLSDLMHYAYQPPEADGKADLQKEIRHVKNYLYLQESRRNTALFVNFSVDVPEHQESLRILPLVLITAVENVFKYGLTEESDKPAEIRIAWKAGKLELFTRNHKKDNPLYKSKYGIGLNNMKMRLNQFYSGRHQLRIHEDRHHFNLALSIEL